MAWNPMYPYGLDPYGPLWLEPLWTPMAWTLMDPYGPLWTPMDPMGWTRMGWTPVGWTPSELL